MRVEATGVSFAEQQMRRGKYYDQPPFPFVPGYDLVGVVERPGTAAARGRQRVAALTKTGGWADRVLLDAADLVPVPDGVDPAAAETVVVNGVTAWRMLHRSARVRAGADRSSCSAPTAASAPPSSQLARARRHPGHRHAPAPRHHDACASSASIPLDYRDEDVPARVRELAPDGVAAVFDHVGGPGHRRLVADARAAAARWSSYGTAVDPRRRRQPAACRC